MNETPRQRVPVDQRDARPFLAFHLRRCADERIEHNGRALDLVARWVENLPARDPLMRRIEETGALDYSDGSFHGGTESEALIDRVRYGDTQSWATWLEKFTDAVERHWHNG